nr:MAG TPA: hypothetical protein [Caudoviricetes sp.]DAY21467.1 MAG TPA: hypothetical protein [Caudoviricetes sp.]
MSFSRLEFFSFPPVFPPAPAPQRSLQPQRRLEI